MKSFRLVTSSLSAAVILLPAWTVADSSVQTEVAASRLVATAHVTIKIIIPQSLYLSVGGDELGAAGAHAVSAMSSNGPAATLTATALRPANDVHGNVILSAAARRVIALEAACRAGDVHVVGGGNGRVFCTASSP